MTHVLSGYQTVTHWNASTSSSHGSAGRFGSASRNLHLQDRHHQEWSRDMFAPAGETTACW